MLATGALTSKTSIMLSCIVAVRWIDPSEERKEYLAQEHH